MHSVYTSNHIMAFLKSNERAFLSTVSRLAFCNPFLPELERFQREALGPEFKTGEPPLSRRTDGPDRMSANSWKVYERLTPLIADLRDRLAAGKTGQEPDLILYEDAVLYLLYFRYLERLSEATFSTKSQPSKARWSFYREFSRDWREYLKIPGTNLPTGHDAAQTFAIFIQFRRAFRYIFTASLRGPTSLFQTCRETSPRFTLISLGSSPLREKAKNKIVATQITFFIKTSLWNCSRTYSKE